MRLSYGRLAALHLALAAGMLALLVAVACYPEPEGDPTHALVERYAPVLIDAGLGDGVWRLRGLTIRVHPQSDGGNWPLATPYRDGYLPDGGPRLLRVLHGYAGLACPSYPGPRIVWVASLSNPVVCHELAHVARSDIYVADAGECVGPGDHDYFRDVRLDAKCREVSER